MALSSMIRKAYPSSVVSITLSLRAIGYSATPKGTILATRLRRHGSVNQSHNFCSLTTAKDLVDASLYKALKNQIKYAKSELKNQVIIPRESFPFQIKEDSDYRTLILTRKFPGDKDINVEIDTLGLNIEEEFESDDDFSSTDDSSEDDNNISDDKKRDGSEKGSNEDYSESKSETELEGDFHDRQVPAIPMTVFIGKPGRSLHFEITVSSKDIVIDSLMISDEKDPRDRVYNADGPKFKEMNFELQRSFYKYLENRGIKVDIARFLYKYIAKMKKKNHLLALKHLKKVIKH